MTISLIRRAGGSRRRVPFKSLPQPWVGAHRGAGALFAPDGSMFGHRYTLAQPNIDNIACDVDCSPLADGTLAVMHDTTVDRTTNGTGALSTLSVAQYKALALDPDGWAPPVPGWGSEPPPLLQEVLNEAVVKAGRPVMIEPKAGNQVTTIAAMVGAYKDQVCLATSDSTILTAIKAAGFPSMWLDTGAVTPSATITALAPTYVAISLVGANGYNTAWRQAMISAGIKIVVYTYARRTEHAKYMALSGVVGSNCDDAFYALGLNRVLTTDEFYAGRYGHGFIPADSNLTRPVFTGTPKRLFFNDIVNGSQWCLMGDMAGASQWSRLNYTVTYDAIGTDTTRWHGCTFGCPDDREWFQGATNAANRGQGYTALLRPNGNLELYRNNGDGLVSTSLATIVATAAIVAGQAVPMQIDFNKVTGAAKVTRLDTGAFIQGAADATWSGPYFHFGKRGGVEGMTVSFSAVTVTP